MSLLGEREVQLLLVTGGEGPQCDQRMTHTTRKGRKLYDLKLADANFFRVLAMIPEAKFEHIGPLWCEAWLTNDEAKRANEFSPNFATEIKR